jgi:hypothetical protein
MEKLTAQDIHQEAMHIAPELPDDWRDLSEEQKALFQEMAQRLSHVAQGEQVKRRPSRRSLITQHRKELEALQNSPIRLSDWSTRFLDKAMNAGMQQYHQVALSYLENGGDVTQTVDALDDDEVLELFQEQGFHVCFNEDIDEG